MANYNKAINCTADTFCNILSSKNNYGSSSVLYLGRYVNTNHSNYYPIFGFDLSDIPTDKIITGITFIFKIDSFTVSGGSSYSYDTSLPIVARARRLYDYDFTTIESTLNASVMQSKSGTDNLDKNWYSGIDTVLNISALSGNIVSMDIIMGERPEDSKLMIGMCIDWNYTNDRSAYAHANISSRTGSYTPQIIVTYSDPKPAIPTNLVPDNSARNKAGEIKLSWNTESLQTKFELSYSKDNFVTQTTVTGNAANSYSIPANIFTDGQTIKWKVRITDNLNSVSDWSDIASFTIGATVPSIPEIISPNNSVVNSSDDVYLKWKFVDSYGYNQAKYDLEYRKGTEAVIPVSGTTSNNYHIIAKNTLQGGDYSWRVRTYNPFNEISGYSDWASFYSIGKPDLPIITSVSNNMHPLVKWTSKEQDIFIIKIYKDNVVVYDSEEQATKDKNEFEVPAFLENGNYKAGLMIRNVYGFWSNEVLYPFAISVSKPAKPSIAGSTNNLFIALIITSTTSTNLIYRKGYKEKEFKLVTELLNENTYLDYSAPAGSNKYFIRAVTASGFNDSDVLTINLQFNGITLAGKENLDDVINLWRTKDSDKRKIINPSKVTYLVNCNGRKYPLSQSTEFLNHAETHEYFIDHKQFDAFFRIATEYNTLLYRNSYGYGFIVEMSNLSMPENEFGYNVSFTLTRLEE